MKKAAAIATELVPVLARHAPKADVDAEFPRASVEALRAAGLFGLLVPTEYGGMGGDLGDMIDAATLLAGGCLSTAMIWAMHCQQVDAVVRHASGSLRTDLLPRIAADGYYLASVTTEPGKGAHLLTASAAIVTSDHQLLVRRAAPVVTGGEFADGFLVTMRAGIDAPPNHVSLVYLDRSQVEADTVGDWNAMGMRGTRSVAMTLSGTASTNQLIGAAGGFRAVAVDSMIPAGHLAWSACWLGAARAALDSLAMLIRSPGRPASIKIDSDLVRHRLARTRVELELCGAYLLHIRNEVAHRRSIGRGMDEYAFQIKLDTLKVACSELTFSAVDRLVQLGGAMTGYQRDAPVPLERHFRDLRSASLNYANDRLLTAIGTLTLLDGAGRLAEMPEAGSTAGLLD
ncbi:acyl-CoA dehydrogenase family protein [Nocardia goodfellowii]|uniref:Alkylation response protein AidB-like acyl-CoA dehydrogenase n=1 Tax=Nocardia goodfellowii TaxID=882446 RepID=A0ABS4QF12_9NOCA|nr:acyl-CoA dehydrogenase family protein [Nocardia goodfellowii]MBP2189683.1 alkylation response protein AidB-like acyl-CoA dehydrogenase [Nocardia goodfellowii]